MDRADNLQRRAWRAWRREQLETDAAALVDTLSDDALVEAFCAIVNAMREQFSDATAVDTMILRYGNVERLIDNLVAGAIDDGEDREVWKGHTEFFPEAA